MERKSPKGRRKAEQILDEATRILVEEGYGAFSMRHVAERLGVRLSNVQYYFDSPAGLLGALFERSMERSISTFEERCATGGLDEAVGFVLSEQDSPEYCMLIWELWALAARDESINEVMVDFYARYQSQVELIIKRVNPELTPTVRRNRALILMSLLEGLSLFRGHKDRLNMSKRQLDKETKRVVNHIVFQDQRA